MGSAAVWKRYNKIQSSIIILALIGIFLSIYALYVEVLKESDEDYQAMCDISSWISCSKVFTSEYGRGFGIIGKHLGEDHVLNLPNSIFGMIFYCLVIVMVEIKSLRVAKFQLAFITLSNLMSIYLAYLLYYVLKDLCVICISTYLVNLLLTILAFMRVRVLQRLAKFKVL